MAKIKSRLIIVAAIFGVATIVACESKFNESSPDSVNMNGTSIGDRLQQKAMIDIRIADLKGKGERLKRILKLFKQVRPASEFENAYTPIDFFIDLNKELKEETPVEQDGRIVRRGSLMLPNVVNEACRKIDTLLESEKIEENGLQTGERLIYSLKGCGTKGQYLPAFEVEFVNDHTNLRMNTPTLNRMLREMLNVDKILATSCQFEGQGDEPIAKIVCTDLKIRLSVSEQALIKELVYRSSGRVRLEAKSEIYEHEMMKALLNVTIFSSGQPKVELVQIPGVQQTPENRNR